ncbi:SRPBCC family protein [Coralloluteibacterium thermophilus]|uniref:SRPBCC family protein n=1 Tax=Coralloluteibacterium thermophilum TaxID=2707049 RepID=A0ABV9NLF9_9GAMM
MAASPRTEELVAARASSGDVPINVQGVERTASLALGTIAALGGLRRGGVGGLLRLAAGAALIHRGVTGRCALKRALEGGSRPYAAQVREEQGWSSAKVATRSVTIARPRAELYALWRDFSNLPRFMEHLEDIEVIDDTRSRWTVSGPEGHIVSWTAEITEDVENERIAWRSDDAAEIRTSGWVAFRDAPNGRGTEVQSVIAYEPPGGTFGHLLAKLFRTDPETLARDDLRRFKQLVETGEIATSEMRSEEAAPRPAGHDRALVASGDAVAEADRKEGP